MYETSQCEHKIYQFLKKEIKRACLMDDCPIGVCSFIIEYNFILLCDISYSFFFETRQNNHPLSVTENRSGHVRDIKN